MERRMAIPRGGRRIRRHQRGRARRRRSGVRGEGLQGSHAVDWISINYKPYDIWGAAFQSPINKTVWDLPGIPNSQWNGLEDRRLHQYKNSPSESHVGLAHGT